MYTRFTVKHGRHYVFDPRAHTSLLDLILELPSRKRKRWIAYITDCISTAKAITDTAQVANWLNTRRGCRFGQTILNTYHPTRSGWNSIDKLMPRNKDDDASRYRAGWNFDRNSCAFDVLVGLAIHLDAWRIQADQCVMLDVQNQAVEWLRNIAHIPWGTISEKERTALRELLRDVVTKQSDTYNELYEPRSVRDVYGIVFAQLPQVSSLTVRRSWCCDTSHSDFSRFEDTYLWCSALQAPKSADPPVLISLDSEADNKSNSKDALKSHQKESGEPRRALRYNISEALQRAFLPARASGKVSTSCPKSDSPCTEIDREVVVIGRLSPTLVLDVSSLVGEWDLKDRGPVGVMYKYLDPAVAGAPLEQRTANYVLEAVVYNDPPGARFPGHFTLESKLQQRVLQSQVHIDMYSGASASESKCEKGTWEIKGSLPSLLVFRLSEEMG